MGKSYLKFSSTWTLSSTSILMYLPMYSNLTQYLPDLVSWGTPFYWGYIFFQTAYPLFTSTIFRCFMICSWEPIQIAALVMNFFVMMSDIWTSLTWTGPSSLGYSFFAAFFLSFAAFSAFSAYSFNLACIYYSVSGLMKVSMMQGKTSFSSSCFSSSLIFLRDSIWFLD